MTVTSRSLELMLNAFAAGRSVVMTGRTDELVLFRGETLGLVDGIQQLAARSHDVVAVFDPIDAWTVVHGRERRDVVSDRRSDAFLAVGDLLAEEEHSVLVIVAQADIVLQDPSTHDVPDRARVAALRRAIGSATTNGLFRNSCVLLASDVGAIPQVVRCTDRLDLIPIGLPGPAERHHLISRRLPDMFDIDTDPGDRAALERQFVRLTDGYSLLEIDSLARYSQVMRLDAKEPRALLHRHRFGETPDHWASVKDDLGRIDAELRANVFGQPDAIDLVVEGLAAASIGLSLNGDPYNLETQPRLVLMLLGPTGVGKTELVKELARCLFGDASAYVRLDMGTFAQEHAAERLMGAPPGYVGFEAGGELTNAVLENPFRVILLDEIEKAHPLVFDRLLSVIDDGRVTDAQGRVAHFNESVIIMTSNLGSSDLAAAAQARVAPRPSTPDLTMLPPDEVREVYRNALRDHFVAIDRPEVLGRLGHGIAVFQPLTDEMIERITGALLDRATFRHGPVLEFDRASFVRHVARVLADPAHRSLGGRQVRNTVRAVLLQVAGWLVLRGNADAERVVVTIDPAGGIRVAVDGADPVLVPSRSSDQRSAS